MGQRLTVFAEPAVDELGTALGALGQTEQRSDQGRVLGTLGDHDLGLADEVGRTHGQQTGVTRPASDERHPSGLGGNGPRCRVGVALLTVVWDWALWARVMPLASRSRSPVARPV